MTGPPGDTPTVVVHRDKALLADAAAARLALAVADAQAARGVADVVLTGGSMGSAIIGSLARSPVKDVADWSRVEVWWGDERFLPTGDSERNETQAREAGLDDLGLDPSRVHPMAGPDQASSPEDSAKRYAGELAGAVARTPFASQGVPEFDVLMLGVGPDAHVASLFPGHPALDAGGTVVGVHGAPKPPPERVSLTFGALERARSVWFLVAGGDKADAVARALAAAPRREAPAGSVFGTESTMWLVDEDAASKRS